MNDFELANRVEAPDAGIGGRLDRLTTFLERLRASGRAAIDDETIENRLARAIHLVGLLEDLAPDLHALAPASEWTRMDEATARVALDTYDRALGQIRTIALDARRRVERCTQVFEDARLFAHRRQRRMERRAARSASRAK
jgi:alkylhydroperoxidase/carboxymuconolactone decarboxylase family protein YurZ